MGMPQKASFLPHPRISCNTRYPRFKITFLRNGVGEIGFERLKGDEMITPETIDTGLIRRTMRAIPYDEAKTAVTRFINETVPDSEPNSWDLSFED